jgi:hypothetical protein
VPWSLAGETGSAIAARPGVRAEQVRRWRPAVRSGGVAALRARPRPGRTPREREAALAAAREGLAGPATERRVRTPARLAAEVARRDDLAGPPGRGAARGGYRWRRPRHAPKGRQAADAVDRAGPRLKLPKRQAAAGVDLHLPFGDEPEAPTHPYLAHRRAARGADLRVEAPGRAKRRALPGVLDHARRELIVVTGGTERSGDFVDLPGRLDRGYGPAPSREGRPVLLVLDDGPIHTGRAARKALAARPRLTVERLPRHAPELNDVERSWGDPKRHSLAHRTFRDADGLDAAIHHAVGALNRERQARACASISRAA